MAKKRDYSSDSSSDDETVRRRNNKVVSSKVVNSSGSSSSSSDDDDDWDAKPKSKAKNKKLKTIKKPAPKSKKKNETPENDDDSDDEIVPKASFNWNQEMEEGEVEDNSDNEEFNDGFDDELMGDEEDRQKLQAMTEKEREEIIFSRSEKREVLKTRFEIERKLRQAKKNEMKKNEQTKQKTTDKSDKDKNIDLSAFVESTSRSTERRRNMEDKRKVKDAIKGLKAEREKKKLKKLRAADVYSDSSDSDSASDAKPSKRATKPSSSSDSSSSSSISDDDSDTDVKAKSSSENRRRDDNEWGKGKSSDAEYETEQFNFTIEHLNSIRLSRFKMEKWCHAPFFKDSVVGCFVRIGVGNSGGVSLYIVGQIVDVVETPKIYMLGKTRTNKGLKLKHAKNPERVYRLEYVSNSEFSAQEYEKWYTKMIVDKCDFPSREFVERKKTDIQRALNYQFSDADVEQIVAEKEKFKNKPVNFAVKKTQLMKEKEYAELNGEHEKAIELSREMDRLEDEAKKLDKLRTQNIAAISFINERNRMRNIKEAERAIAESAKDAQIKDDPFTRRKCAPTMISNFNKKGEQLPLALSENFLKGSLEPTALDVIDSVNPKGNSAAVSNGTKSSAGGRSAPESAGVDSDDLFSAHNFDIKIDFDLPFNSNTSSNANSFSGGFLSDFSNGNTANGFTDIRPNSLVNSGANRRSLNLDEYKKKKGLI